MVAYTLHVEDDVVSIIPGQHYQRASGHYSLALSTSLWSLATDVGLFPLLLAARGLLINTVSASALK